MRRFHPSAVNSFLGLEASEAVFLGSAGLGFLLKKREIIELYYPLDFILEGILRFVKDLFYSLLFFLIRVKNCS